MRSDCGRICIRLEPKQAVITEYGPYMDAADGDTAVISEQHPYQSNPVYLTALQQYEQAFARYTALVMGSNVYGSSKNRGQYQVSPSRQIQKEKMKMAESSTNPTVKKLLTESKALRQ
jgi:hypothetical protein